MPGDGAGDAAYPRLGAVPPDAPFPDATSECRRTSPAEMRRRHRAQERKSPSPGGIDSAELGIECTKEQRHEGTDAQAAGRACSGDDDGKRRCSALAEPGPIRARLPGGRYAQKDTRLSRPSRREREAVKHNHDVRSTVRSRQHRAQVMTCNEALLMDLWRGREHTAIPYGR